MGKRVDCEWDDTNAISPNLEDAEWGSMPHNW
jgi:hypothetical protein